MRERTKKAPGKPEQQEWDFAAQANAMVVKDAESYYRNMYFKGLPSSEPTICRLRCGACQLFD